MPNPTRDEREWTIWMCPECGEVSGCEQPCPGVTHAMDPDAPLPVTERYLPASRLLEAERERGEARAEVREARRVLSGKGRGRLDEMGREYLKQKARAEAAESQLSAVREEAQEIADSNETDTEYDKGARGMARAILSLLSEDASKG